MRLVIESMESKNGKLRIEVSKEEESKSELYQDILIANPHDLKKQMKLRFLVDTGASGTAIPEKVALELGLECVGEGRVVLADGTRIRTKVAYVYMRINDEHVFTLVAYNGCDSPLLGFDVMSLLSLQIDTEKKRLLKPLRRFKLTNLLFTKDWISRKHEHERLDKESAC
jgi:clan AA aspartic protease